MSEISDSDNSDNWSNSDLFDYSDESEYCVYCEIKNKCIKCNKNICECDQIIEIFECKDLNCYYCKRGKCYNNREQFYCKNCVPQYVLDNNKERNNRKPKLEKALELMGLKLRNDSVLCNKYISNGIGKIEKIVERMCQMKFLFEYHDIRKEIENIYEEYKIYDEFDDEYYYKLSYNCVFKLAEEIILRKIGGLYPDIYPWIKEEHEEKMYNVFKELEEFNSRPPYNNWKLGGYIYREAKKNFNNSII